MVTALNRLDFRTGYAGLVKRLRRRHSRDRAMRLAIGGQFEAFGIVERAIVVQYGLRPEASVLAPLGRIVFSFLEFAVPGHQSLCVLRRP